MVHISLKRTRKAHQDRAKISRGCAFCLQAFSPNFWNKNFPESIAGQNKLKWSLKHSCVDHLGSGPSLPHRTNSTLSFRHPRHHPKRHRRKIRCLNQCHLLLVPLMSTYMFTIAEHKLFLMSSGNM